MNLLYWWKAKHMWKKDLTSKEKYKICKYAAHFGELQKVFPLHIVQKRGGY